MTKRAQSKKHAQRSLFDRLAGGATRAAGSPYGFGFAVLTVLVWAGLGPVFDYSETWQLVVNTGTTIITFLMVFLIQQSQNKDSCALHLKLNELLASHHMASNSLLNLEDLDEKELHKLREFYLHLASLSEKAEGIKESHSIDEAKASHRRKHADKNGSKSGFLINNKRCLSISAPLNHLHKFNKKIMLNHACLNQGARYTCKMPTKTFLR